MSTFRFRNKRTKKVIEVEGVYVWSSDKFFIRYLGRRYVGYGEPLLGRNYDYIGNEQK